MVFPSARYARFLMTKQGSYQSQEFKMGKCQRGPRCRYWHVDPETERQNRFGDPRGRGPPSSMGRGAPQNGVSPWGGGGAPPMHQGGPPMHSVGYSFIQNSH